MERYEELAKRFFGDRRDYFSDLMRFAAYLDSKPPITAKSYITAVKELV